MLGQFDFIQVLGMRAAPLLEIARTFERQLALQIAPDEIVIFDELAIEARSRCLRICWGNSSSVHTQAFLRRLIMTRRARGICEIIGIWTAPRTPSDLGRDGRHDLWPFQAPKRPDAVQRAGGGRCPIEQKPLRAVPA